MSAFKITTEKKYDGAIEISVEGEDEILKNVDMLELVKQAVGPAKDDADNVMKKLDDMEGRIGTVETKVDAINKRLDRIDERLDKFLDRLDRFNHLAPENSKWTQTPSQPHVDDNDDNGVSPKVSWITPKYDTTPIPNYSTEPYWMTAPDQATRERLWHYWHNPDGTLKLNCSANDAGIKGVDAGGYTGGVSCGVDFAEGESWTTKATVTGKGEVVSLGTMPPKPNVDLTTSKNEDNQ